MNLQFKRFAYIAFLILTSVGQSQAQLTKNLGIELIGPMRGQSKQVNMFIAQGLGLDYQLTKEVTGTLELSLIQGLVWRERRQNDRTFPFGTSAVIGGKFYPVKEFYLLGLAGTQSYLEKYHYKSSTSFALYHRFVAIAGIGICPSQKFDLSFRVQVFSDFAYASIRGAYRF